MSIKEATTYNNKGLITQKKTETGNLTTTENYTYDARGRVLTQTSSAGRSVSYAYGNRTVSSTTNGKTYTRVYDPWGGVKSVTDPVSSIACAKTTSPRTFSAFASSTIILQKVSISDAPPPLSSSDG